MTSVINKLECAQNLTCFKCHEAGRTKMHFGDKILYESPDPPKNGVKVENYFIGLIFCLNFLLIFEKY